jgi:uncharacterized membrane protein
LERAVVAVAVEFVVATVAAMSYEEKERREAVVVTVAMLERCEGTIADQESQQNECAAGEERVEKIVLVVDQGRRKAGYARLQP